MAGQRIFGRYTLQRLLGRGGMGVVWSAWDESLEREVAIKMLPELVAGDPSSVRELKRQTSRCQQLSHSHILRIYDFVEGGGLCGITMELVAGGTLTARRLDQPGEAFKFWKSHGRPVRKVARHLNRLERANLDRSFSHSPQC